MTACPSPAALTPLPAAHRKGPAGVLRALAQALALRRQRRQLAEMDAARLHDIGLTRDEALREAGRPFWDAPVHWR